MASPMWILGECVAGIAVASWAIRNSKPLRKKGRLFVKAKSADKVAPADSNSLLGGEAVSSDPYLLVRCGIAEARTRTVEKDLNPKWDETMEIELDEAKGDVSVVTLELKDANTFKSDVSLGHMKLDLFSFTEMPRSFDALLKDGRGATLHVDVWFVPDAETPF
mmetsp:Transcript_35880/g.78567  ORF Transcript_35880/g.78567 Transcript_35880/m.78567 type:complete len:164 (+) Transcript_35880:57-548(+)|eukprot:CAMPEP_0170617890 /NCGR_PEP_ID=MMETSP0224-20130122/26665_1 /TAXON_ID=285029 /ORGANISM="Togula jolla, Strain CCCM 725" /LENGTH=163 /DNA_ID=CAMNT_0010943825 /DNA_START=57 /DNA_END=548 /DNA_ORIENTATION=+